MVDTVTWLRMSKKNPIITQKASIGGRGSGDCLPQSSFLSVKSI